ncbi:MAG TPA: hypothetical protein PKE03_09575, partial [Bacteroidales bacterium]|nr:hypothetical protein [Bacteroidales bacterium]
WSATAEVAREHTYALATDSMLPEPMSRTAHQARLEASLSYHSGSNAMLVFSLMAADTLRYWAALPLNTLDSLGNANAGKLIILPPDYLKGATLRTYFWNPDSATFTVNKAEIQIRPHRFPGLLPSVEPSAASGRALLLFQTARFELHYHPQSGHLILADARGRPLSGPFQWHLEVLKGNDTLHLTDQQWKLSARFFSGESKTAVLKLCNPYERLKLRVTTDEHCGIAFSVESRMRKRVSVVRQALVMPFIDKPEAAVDDRALTWQPDGLQALYLGQGGFVAGKDERRLTMLQSRQLAAVQIDTEHRRLIANITFAPAHPMIQYPLDEDRQDYFIDLSAPPFHPGHRQTGSFVLWPAAGSAETPRLMPIPGGAEAAVVWTEHADWTDIRTQRAVHFGCDTIHQAANAVGGFDKYGIPVTKSVFYHNPEGITNVRASRGLFTGKHATLTDRDFLELIRQLHRLGHEICLHTPEQYSSTRRWMKQALSFAGQQFDAKSWIDHGYNNSVLSNRENMAGDGLRKGSRHYASDLWQRYGVRYLWNAALEELRPYASYGFDGNFIIPYPGFGPVLPGPVFMRHASAPGFLLWNTTGTLEMPDDGRWEYGFAPARLEHLMQYHSIWINHVYPAWTFPGKGFWTYDADSNIVAMPGFNKALERLSHLEKSGRLLNATLRDLAGYHEALDKLELIPLEGHVLKVINHNPFTVSRISFATPSPMVNVRGKAIHQRRHHHTTYFWFDLSAGEAAEISY